METSFYTPNNREQPVLKSVSILNVLPLILFYVWYMGEIDSTLKNIFD